MSEVPIGRVTHFYGKISVAVLGLSDTIRLGDTVHILGRTTDFQQEVSSLQIEHQAISQAKPGQEVALKVDYPVRRRDSVFKVVA
jgi:translation elongation factor EF-1alpha